MKFPKDAPKRKIIKSLERLGFRTVKVGSHISMVRENPDAVEHP
jgi:predicted RNA binding protein YcfA (HicA-like mRNA interferase family)